jgi:hypothetical protein
MGVRLMARPNSVWTPEKLAELQRLINRKATPKRAAAIMGTTKGAVLRAASDNGLTFLVRG